MSDVAPGSSADRLIDAAMRLLEEHGEGGFRTEDVLAETGLSNGTLYHHFGSRDGLIEAAALREFERRTLDDVVALRTLIKAIADGADAPTMFRQIGRIAQGPERHGRRRRRLAVLGAAVHRPDLWAAIGAIQGQSTDALAEVITEAQRSGWVKAELDPRAIAAFSQAYTFGRVLDELSPDPVPIEHWHAIVDSFLQSIISQPPPRS